MDGLPVATGEWKPYTSVELDGYGFFSKIVTAVFGEAGLEVDYGFFPWKRCAAYVRNGDYFAAFPYSVTAERETFAYFSEPVSETTTVFFYNTKKHKNPIEFGTLADLKPYAIVGVLGYFYEERFKQELVNVNYVPTEKKALELVFHNRYDLLPLSDYVGWDLIKRNYPQRTKTFATCKTPLSQDTLHLMISKQYPDSRKLMNRFNAALIRIKSAGIYQKIVSSNFPELHVKSK